MINGNMKRNSAIYSAMTPRLLLIAEAARGAKTVADIGTDHAYVPVYMCLELGTLSAVAADINTGPLERADANIKKYGLSDRITTRLSDGLKKFVADEADTVVIAGMGGTLIAKILEDSPQMKTENIRFVLQPMTAEEELRRYLTENGYEITDERMTGEGEKLYTVITAEVGESEEYDEVFYHVGKKLLEKKDKLFPLFIERKIAEFEKVADGLSKATPSPERDEKKGYCLMILGELKKIAEECRTW